MATLPLACAGIALAQTPTYVVEQGNSLAVAAPGVLTGVSMTSSNLTASLVNGTAHGQLNLNTDGSFTYQPGSGFTGMDNFSCQVSDGVNISNPFCVSISVTPQGTLFFDDFGRATQPGPLSPWVSAAGEWTVLACVLQDPIAYDEGYEYVLLTNSWTDYAVQENIQLSADTYGGGLGGRVAVANGAHYAAWIYPPFNNLNLIKFQEWGTPTFLGSADLPPIGTDWHTLKLAFSGNQIAVYYDGTQVLSVADTNAPLLSGGLSLEMYSDYDSDVMSVDNVLVSPLAAPAHYSINQNGTLTVPAPGILAGDTGVYGTNLAVTLVNGPANGTVSLGTNGDFIYTPSANYLGTDSFTYQLNDGGSNPASAVVTIVVSPTAVPIANNDIFSYVPGTTLSVVAPGVLGNDVAANSNVLNAVLVSGPVNGSVALNSTGGFTYSPAPSFTGVDTFTYQVVNGGVTSAPAVVTLTDLALGALFCDTFSEASEPSSLAPWVTYSGDWSVQCAALAGVSEVQNAYGAAYLTNSWTDYSVQGKFQFAAGAYGGGLAGRLDPATGAHYAAWMYPCSDSLNLIKFQDWATPSFLAVMSVPRIGTQCHSVKLSFQSNSITVFYDGNQMTNLTDNGLAEQPALLGGSVGVEMYTLSTLYQMSVQDVVVFPAVLHNGPMLPGLGPQSIIASSPLVVTNTALDSDMPALALTYSLISPPPGAAISSNGVITWTPAWAQGPGTNVITTVVTDSGTPPLSATNSFTVVVSEPLSAPWIASITITNGGATITWNAVAGHTYQLQRKADLNNSVWTVAVPSLLASGPIAVGTDPQGVSACQFYRVLLLQ